MIQDNTYADLSRIFDMMPPSMIKKINPKFINNIKKKAINSKGISSINPYIPLKEQKISKEVQYLLILIWKDYFQEKKEINDVFNKKIEETKNKNINNKNEEISLEPIKNERILKMFFYKIKNFFRYKK